MAVSVSWIEAARLIGAYGNEALAGWPASLDATSIACLQSGYSVADSWADVFAEGEKKRPKDAAKKEAFSLWSIALESAIDAGEVVTVSVRVKRRTYYHAHIDDPLEERIEEFDRSKVTALAFEKWLAAQRREPSEHVIGWFRSQGIQWPAEGSRANARADQLPNAQKPAIEEASPIVSEPQSFSELVALRDGKKGTDWTDAERAILATELAQPGVTLGQLGKALGISRQAVKIQIEKHKSGDVGKRERGKRAM